jgi:hypothetical protein
VHLCRWGNGCRISDSPLVINLGKALALEVDEDVHIESAWWERGGFMSSIIPSMRDWRPHRCITVTSNDRLSGRTERSESEQNLAMRRTKTVVYLRVTEC